jgi:hypothetical protein
LEKEKKKKGGRSIFGYDPNDLADQPDDEVTQSGEQLSSASG